MFAGISMPLGERSVARASCKVFRHPMKRGDQVPSGNFHSHSRLPAPSCVGVNVSRHIIEPVASETPLYSTNLAVCIICCPKVHVSSREALIFLSESINLVIITGRNLKMQFRPDSL